MAICGVIAEYNPFHNGHAFHLAQARALTGSQAVVCVMSGHFVQRGEAAVFAKQARVRMALLNGADMVLELPVPYATAGAERFASAAVEILEACGMVDSLCFGSESGDLQALDAAADALASESPLFQTQLRAALAEGVSFPTARSFASGGAVDMPNDILGVEYLKAIKRQSSRLTPVIVTRRGAGYHDNHIEGALASATSIRQAMRKLDGDTAIWKAAMPLSAAELAQEECAARRGPVATDDLSQAFLYALRTTPPEALARRADVSEGLENRILRCAEDWPLWSAIVGAVKTKRYTYTRIQRAMLHILLQIDAVDCAARVPYIRVLGFRRSAEHLVRRLCAAASLPVITNLKHAHYAPNDAVSRVLHQELRAAEIYRMAVQARGGHMKNERREALVITD